MGWRQLGCGLWRQVASSVLFQSEVMLGLRHVNACCSTAPRDISMASLVECLHGMRCNTKPTKELICQAAEASRHLGECPETMPRSEADLRVFVHDLLHCMTKTIAPWRPFLLDRTLHVIRMASDGDLSTEVITGALSSVR